MKKAASTKGRKFNKVSHPTPESEVIEAEWPITVEIGEIKIY